MAATLKPQTAILTLLGIHVVAAVLFLDVEHLLVHLLHGQVSPVSGVAGSHHLLGVEHLLLELGHGEGPVQLGAPGGEGGEHRHKERGNMSAS